MSLRYLDWISSSRRSTTNLVLDGDRICDSPWISCGRQLCRSNESATRPASDADRDPDEDLTEVNRSYGTFPSDPFLRNSPKKRRFRTVPSERVTFEFRAAGGPLKCRRAQGYRTSLCDARVTLTICGFRLWSPHWLFSVASVWLPVFLLFSFPGCRRCIS